MKYSFLFILLFAVITVGAGCKRDQPTQTNNTPSTTPVVTETPQPEPADTLPATTTEKTLYRGTWFDVQYPENFTAFPTSPTFVATTGDIRIQTNEAKFVSPDGTVEFFVFSPQWGGDPTDYLKIKAIEELASEKIEESGADEADKTTTRWVTVKAKDNSYYRSFISIKRANDGSSLHHVLGIKYKDTAAYEKYLNDYTQFKESLRQYSD